MEIFNKLPNRPEQSITAEFLCKTHMYLIVLSGNFVVKNSLIIHSTSWMRNQACYQTEYIGKAKVRVFMNFRLIPRWQILWFQWSVRWEIDWETPSEAAGILATKQVFRWELSPSWLFNEKAWRERLVRNSYWCSRVVVFIVNFSIGLWEASASQKAENLYGRDCRIWSILLVDCICRVSWSSPSSNRKRVLIVATRVGSATSV